MGKDLVSCIMKTADRFFGSVSSEGSALLLDGLESELEAAARTGGSVTQFRGACADIEHVMRAAKLVKDTGVYPFYITRLAAAALHCEAQEEVRIENAILMSGVKQAAEMLFDMAQEPELLYLIETAYAQLLDGRLAEIDVQKLALLRAGYENGFYNEKTYHGCAQCTIKAFLDTMKLEGGEAIISFPRSQQPGRRHRPMHRQRMRRLFGQQHDHRHTGRAHA